jgi:hypothetical protein
MIKGWDTGAPPRTQQGATASWTILRPHLFMALSRSFLLLGGFAMFATSGAAASPASELPSAFFISKSENKNQVHYAVALDQNCVPAGAAPVRPYWRLLEKSPTLTAPLLAREQRAYGLASQSVDLRWTSGGRISLVLEALPKRELTIVTGKDAKGACVASVYTVIQNQPAQLYAIHVVLKWSGVDSLIIKGWARSDGHILREKLRP